MAGLRIFNAVLSTAIEAVVAYYATKAGYGLLAVFGLMIGAQFALVIIAALFAVGAGIDSSKSA